MFVHLEREYRIMQRLKGHPNLVEAIDYIEERHKGRGYLVMERVFGQSVLNYVVHKWESAPLTDEILVQHIMRSIF